MVIKWIRNLLVYALVLVFIVTLVSAVTSRINGGTPKILGKEILTVLSGSMEPGIQTGAVIAVNPIQAGQQGSFETGDVITFRALDGSNTLITHRIVSVQGSGDNLEYITKGDNNEGQDLQPIPSENVVASYTGFTLPFLGYFLNWVKSTAGIVVVMVIPGIFLVISSLITLFKSIMRMEEPAEPQLTAGESPPLTNG